MPELFGIFREDGLLNADCSAFDRLQKGFKKRFESNTKSFIADSLAVGVISHHLLDSAILVDNSRSGAVGAWIGHGADQKVVSSLVPQLVAGRFAALEELDAPFAGCLFDSNASSVWLFADPFGLHPLYYAFQDGILCFSTKIHPLLNCDAVSWSPDDAAVLDFFAYEHVTGDRTFADTVRVVPAGTVIATDGRALNATCYVDPFERRPDSLSTATRADALYAALRDSVRRSIENRDRVGILLSGGLDSRALLGFALDAGANIRAFTFGTPDCRDVLYARRLAEIAGIPHEYIPIDGAYLSRWIEHGIYTTGGMVSCHHYHILSLADSLIGSVDVVLDGLGGDALTGAHLKPAMLWAQSADAAAGSVRKQRVVGWLADPQRLERFRSSNTPSSRYNPSQAIDAYSTTDPLDPFWYACHRFDLQERQRRFIQFGPHLLRPMVEVATPFYSRDVVKIMCAAPATQLFEQRAYQHMLRTRSPALSRVPDAARRVPLSWPTAARFVKKLLDVARRRILGKNSRLADGPTDYAAWYPHQIRPLLEAALRDASPDEKVDADMVNAALNADDVSPGVWGPLLTHTYAMNMLRLQ